MQDTVGTGILILIGIGALLWVGAPNCGKVDVWSLDGTICQLR